MVNYSLEFSVAEVVQFLRIEREIVIKWGRLFTDYLSRGANPAEGQSRKFTLNDVRVMSYVSMHWEDDPDIEYIKIGLNSGNHYDNELIDDLITEITPLFIDPPIEINENWTHGVLLTGLSEYADILYLANSYKLAGDRLIEMALENDEAWDLFCPAIYSYRHATELYLKSIILNHKKNHDLLSLYESFKLIMKTKFDSNPPKWFENVVMAFNDFDGGGTMFRYGGEIKRHEAFVDFRQFKILMQRFGRSCQNIRLHLDSR